MCPAAGSGRRPAPAWHPAVSHHPGDHCRLRQGPPAASADEKGAATDDLEARLDVRGRGCCRGRCPNALLSSIAPPAGDLVEAPSPVVRVQHPRVAGETQSAPKRSSAAGTTSRPTPLRHTYGPPPIDVESVEVPLRMSPAYAGCHARTRTSAIARAWFCGPRLGSSRPRHAFRLRLRPVVRSLGDHLHVSLGGYRLGSDRGSPNHCSTSASKRTIAQIRSPASVSTYRPVPWGARSGTRT